MQVSVDFSASLRKSNICDVDRSIEYDDDDEEVEYYDQHEDYTPEVYTTGTVHLDLEDN